MKTINERDPWRVVAYTGAGHGEQSSWLFTPPSPRKITRWNVVSSWSPWIILRAHDTSTCIWLIERAILENKANAMTMMYAFTHPLDMGQKQEWLRFWRPTVFRIPLTRNIWKQQLLMRCGDWEQQKLVEPNSDCWRPWKSCSTRSFVEGIHPLPAHEEYHCRCRIVWIGWRRVTFVPAHVLYLMSK